MAWADRPPLEQAAINYCAPRGIPLSVFLGRVVYPGDPQWTDDDRDAAFEWLVEQSKRCSDCGQPLDECTAKDNSYAYHAEAVRCHACYAINVEASRLAGGKPSPAAGHRYRVALRDVS